MIDDETASMSIVELRQRTQLIDNEIRIFRSDIQRINHESRGQRERIRENIEKVKLNKQLPYLVGMSLRYWNPTPRAGWTMTMRRMEVRPTSTRNERPAVLLYVRRRVRRSTFRSPA